MIYKYLYLINKQLVTAGVPELKEFDWFTGQGTANYQGGVKTPCGVFMRILPTQMKDLANGVQEGEMSWELITIVDSKRDGDKRIDPTVGLTDPLATANRVYLSIYGKNGKLSDLPAFAALEGTENDYTVMNTVTRTNIVTDHGNKGLFTQTQTFKAYVKDLAAYKKFTKILTTLEITDFELL